ATASKESYMISLFFTKDSFGDEFFELPEFNSLKAFFIDTQYGFKIDSSNNPKQFGSYAISKFIKYDKLDRLIHFLRLLKQINESDKKPLSSFVHKKQYTDNEGRRMSSVFELAMNEYYRDITLDEVAGVSSMTPNAFCRYFKNRTNKTFFQFLIEVRIENACKLLSKNNDLSIAEVAYQCGFKNISNFNRKFKSVKNITPSKYRQKAYALRV
ncbi:MAG: helix-turn-helix transcriptional regulator, partial [Flavobacteriaceae bacterium]|nr:helix-turn-helix transcriptional regulator [Flavobacteriaceae bacterium]